MYKESGICTHIFSPASPDECVSTVAGHLGHFALYTGLIVMPASGIAMGYYGGKVRVPLSFLGYISEGRESVPMPESIQCVPHMCQPT